MKNNLSFINVYKKSNLKNKIVTQLLYGESFKKIKKGDRWIKVKNKIDGYNGYIKNKNFPADTCNTHKVFKISANLYAKPNIKNKIKKKLSFGSRIKVLKKKVNSINLIIYGLKKKI